MFNLVDYMTATPYPLPEGEFVRRPNQYEDCKSDYTRKSDQYYKDFILEVVEAGGIVAKSAIRETTGMERVPSENKIVEVEE